MNFVAAFLASAARHLRGETPACPDTTQCSTGLIATERPSVHITEASKERTPMIYNGPPLFAKSQLNRQEFSDGALVDAVDICFCDGSVQRAAGEALARLNTLDEMIGLRSEIALGIDAAVGADRDTSKIAPEFVVQAIKRRTAEIEDALAAAKADKSAHNAVHKARRDRLKALSNAINKVFSDLQAESAGLLRKIDSLSVVGDFDSNAKRARQLREAGLTTDQINALVVPQAIDREATINAARARIAEIGTLLPKCRDFWDDPWRRTDVLVGLGLDEEIAQYEACRVEPYEVPA